MEASSSSKVTVEYHDPAGVFPLVSREIQSRLPLRNLNWHSPPRPLRQIRFLHLDFVPDKDTQPATKPPSSRADSNGPSSFDIVRSGLDVRKNAVKERRHQIPGLKTSPYLKIYVLRCDDKSGYKEAERKRIREWIKENALPDGKRENHDAFEWMILHVVLPDTIAASEPRWRESSTKDSDELKERKSGGAKWPGKSSRTVFDRLRADFNESKAGHDRVAQIRLVKDRVPPDLLPTPAVAATLEESPQERENAWNDLITKFKTLILDPFDRRVRQYEADIAEQESRRSLPGWNFCTFFINKEGLAKALESVGLVEDALALYDELTLDLETTLRMMASGEAQGTATSFADFTDDIQDRITCIPQEHSNGTTNATQDAIRLFNKDYREKIVRSNISVFDFFCYLFTRQKALILRLANTRNARLRLDASNQQEGGEDLVLASEVCWRASSFIHNTARVLRHDLWNGPLAERSNIAELDIESLVCSWTYAVAGQVLEETAVPAFLNVTKFESQERSQVPNGKPKQMRPVSVMALGANPYPQRTTSLSTRKLELPQRSQPSSNLGTDSNDTLSPPSSSGNDSAQPAGLPGQAELATYRAELIVMRRKMVEQLAERHRWYAGWAVVRQRRSKSLKRTSLNGGDETPAPSDPSPQVSTLLGPTLRDALASETAFSSAYEAMTNLAIRHYFAATQSKSAEMLVGDLAMLKAQQNDYSAAVSYFQHILPLYADDGWNSVEAEALKQYAVCLKKLQRNQDYVQTMLKLLAKVVARKMQPPLPRLSSIDSAFWQSDVLPDASALFEEVISASEGLTQKTTLSLEDHFGDVKLHQEVLHAESSDATVIHLQLRHLSEDSLNVDAISARLVGLDNELRVVEFASATPLTLSPGLNTIGLETQMVTLGPYAVNEIWVDAGNLRFVQNLAPKPEPSQTPLGILESQDSADVASLPRSLVYLYPPQHALSAEVRRSKNILIDRPRQLEVVLNSGWNDVSELRLQIKPLSAGLRLHLGDAVANGIQTAPGNSDHPGQLVFGAIGQHNEAIVTIPYTLEQAISQVAVRFEVHYKTSNGAFIFLDSASLANELPLDVDVNDIFHLEALFSSFTVRTTSQSPSVILDAQLADSIVYAAQSPPLLPFPSIVFGTQPMKLLYKVSRKQATTTGVLKKDAALALRIRYLSFGTLARHILRKTFLQDLEESKYSPLSRLLTSLLLDRCQKLTNSDNMEIAAFLGEMKLPDFEAMGWHEIAQTLPDPVQQPLLGWLRGWHAENTAIMLNDTGHEDAVTQQITISVDVPNVDMVFAATMEFNDEFRTLNEELPIITLGQIYKAVLRVRHTNSWSAKAIFPSVPSVNVQGEDPATSRFVLDIGVEPDTWIVGGQRRCHFSPEEGIDQVFTLTLIPMRPGIHALPHVDVHVESADLESEGQNSDEPSLTCETHYESAGQMVRVVRELRTAMIEISEAPDAMPLPVSRPGTSST